jgi:hypothetical protein
LRPHVGRPKLRKPDPTSPRPKVFAHLDKIDVSSSYIEQDMQKALKEALPNVEIGRQTTGYDSDDHYVSVSE